MGLAVGDVVGEVVGLVVGDVVGEVVGFLVGDVVGEVVGDIVGVVVGEVVGLVVGNVVGVVVGLVVGGTVDLDPGGDLDTMADQWNIAARLQWYSLQPPRGEGQTLPKRFDSSSRSWVFPTRQSHSAYKTILSASGVWEHGSSVRN